jgi:hypothetical protein
MLEQWTQERAQYIRGLKTPTEYQQIILMLLEKAERTAEESKKLNVLLKAERAAARAQAAKADAVRIMNADKLAERKARDHEMYQAAGLLAMAGLVDRKTGKPTRDRGELLGALLALAKSNIDEAKRSEWKRVGDEALSKTGTAAVPEVSISVT